MVKFLTQYLRKIKYYRRHEMGARRAFIEKHPRLENGRRDLRRSGRIPSDELCRGVRDLRRFREAKTSEQRV